MVDKFPCGCNHNWTDHHMDETLITNLLSLATLSVEQNGIRGKEN